MKIMDTQDIFLQHLAFLYGKERAEQILPRLQALLDKYHSRLSGQGKSPTFSQRDAVLITYGDMVQADGEASLATLADFLQQTVTEGINTVHILPFYPYSSDDGFSVVDYTAVNPTLGTWSDVHQLGHHFRLMFDAVINHISAHSDWFQKFLADDPVYRDYFTVVDPAADLTAVFRPRALPLLTEVKTAVGPKHVWTTFSADQIDLNYANPDVLLAVLDVLLFYVTQGASLIRLDAIGFMWKEIGTSCLHLPQAHRAIQLMRSVLDAAAPRVALITETNVPHRDNIAYFGNGHNEAQMVYNFSLPPLTLHAFHSGDATILSKWASTLDLPSDRTTFFNFLASHDGIGLMPARGILPEATLNAIAQRVEALGGLVSYKNNPDGSQAPYELNINYLDALGDPTTNEDDDLRARRFLVAQAIMLSLRGIPGIYFHSLFGSRGWREGVTQTGHNRTINRQKLPRPQLEAELADPNSLRAKILNPYLNLLRLRGNEAAFHPNGRQTIHRLHPAIFAVERRDPAGRHPILCLQNVSNQSCTLSLAACRLGTQFTNLLDAAPANSTSFTLPAYGIAWLKPQAIPRSSTSAGS